MQLLVNWALGILFTLILGAFAYATRLDSTVEARIERAESRLESRIDRQDVKLDRLEDKIDKLLQRPFILPPTPRNPNGR